MTRDQLELVLAREGLTRPQTHAVLEAAEAYALTQCQAAIEAYAPADVRAMYYSLPVMHWQAYRPVAGPACDPLSGEPCTTVRADVRCEACKETQAWKKAAA